MDGVILITNFLKLEHFNRCYPINNSSCSVHYVTKTELNFTFYLDHQPKGKLSNLFNNYYNTIKI